MMYSACKLNKQGDNIQSSHIPSPILNQFVLPCLVLTVASCPACKFLSRQVSWCDIPNSLRIFQFLVIHPVKSFSIVNEAEVDIFLELPCFLHHSANVFSLISGFLCLIETHLVHLEVIGSRTVEASLEGF